MTSIDELKKEIKQLKDQIRQINSCQTLIVTQNQQCLNQLMNGNKDLNISTEFLTNLISQNNIKHNDNAIQIKSLTNQISKLDSDLSDLQKEENSKQKIESNLQTDGETNSDKGISLAFSEIAISGGITKKLLQSNCKSKILTRNQHNTHSTSSSQNNDSRQNSSVEQQSVKSSSITSDTVSIARFFSKLSMASKKIINKAYGILVISLGQNINWLDLSKDKMSNYKYSEFDWPSSKAGVIAKNNKVKHQVNESADTNAALSHLLKEINLFLKIYNGSSLDSLFIKIENVSLSSEYDLQLYGFETYGRTDLVISPSHIEDVLDMNYCNIQLKSVVKYRHGSSDEIFKSSDADQEKLTAQSLAELLGSIPLSKCPIMQFTTDLDQNFHIMFFYEDNKDNELQLHHYNLSGTDAIATLAVWLLYFCPHRLYSKSFQPKTKDLKLLENIQRAHQNIKKKISSNSLDIPIKHNSELHSVTDNLPICLITEQDYTIKCQKWVDSLNF